MGICEESFWKDTHVPGHLESDPSVSPAGSAPVARALSLDPPVMAPFHEKELAAWVTPGSQLEEIRSDL